MIYQWDRQTETITDYIFLGKERVTEAQVSLGDGSQSVDNTNVGYTGHQWDDDSGLNYMQARYYDPLLGRFLSNDPVGYIASNPIMSFNRYLYTNNNPYRYVDPDGRVLLVVGDNPKETEKLNAIVEAVETSGDTVLEGKIRQLRGSANLHFVEAVSPGEAPKSKANRNPADAHNGNGTGSTTKLSLEDFTTPGGFTSTPEGVGAHELGGHAANIDKGVADDPSKPAEAKKEQSNAIDMGNKYRATKNEKLRLKIK
ncbi:MAG: RHS repeat-associated core domain-containing protein [Algicola sp.]|nr:RHS repeat-associated core domain-containing protein [Algicola sp.]